MNDDTHPVIANILLGIPPELLAESKHSNRATIAATEAAYARDLIAALDWILTFSPENDEPDFPDLERIRELRAKLAEHLP